MKPTRNIEWLQDTIMGAAFLMRTLNSRYGHDFSNGMDAQVTEFLADARKVEQAIMARPKKGD